MSVQTTCPKCNKTHKVEDNVLGRNIKCPACATVFRVKADASGVPSAKTAPASPKRQPSSSDDDPEDEVPRRPARATPKAVDDDEDDEDDQPQRSARKKSRKDRPVRKRKKKGSSSTVLLIGGAIGLFVCGGGCGLSYYLYTRTVAAVGGAMTDALAQLPTFKDPEGITTKKSEGEQLAGPKPASFPAGWTEAKLDKYGFRVMLPGTFKPDLLNLNKENDADFRLDVPAEQEGFGARSGYWIKITEYKGAEEPEKAEFVLDSQPIFGELHAEGKKSINVKKGNFAGKPGRAWDVEPKKGGGMWHFRACVVGNRVFILGAGPDPKIPAADADRFFASFELRAK
jgi:hypothetical protein